jgi:hypothetical protein
MRGTSASIRHGSAELTTRVQNRLSLRGFPLIKGNKNGRVHLFGEGEDLKSPDKSGS